MATPNLTAGSRYSNGQIAALFLLRLSIGWHFLYEGVVKLWNPNWSAAPYLADSGGWFADMFQNIASSPATMEVVNVLNVWGLVLVGMGLLLGALSRWAALGGILLLGMYYLSHPPLLDVQYALPSEGSYLWVNKNLIEMLALVVIMAFPTSQLLGLDRFLQRHKSQPQPAKAMA